MNNVMSPRSGTPLDQVSSVLTVSRSTLAAWQVRWRWNSPPQPRAHLRAPAGTHRSVPPRWSQGGFRGQWSGPSWDGDGLRSPACLGAPPESPGSQRPTHRDLPRSAPSIICLVLQTPPASRTSHRLLLRLEEIAGREVRRLPIESGCSVAAMGRSTGSGPARRAKGGSPIWIEACCSLTGHRWTGFLPWG